MGSAMWDPVLTSRPAGITTLERRARRRRRQVTDPGTGRTPPSPLWVRRLDLRSALLALVPLVRSTAPPPPPA